MVAISFAIRVRAFAHEHTCSGSRFKYIIDTFYFQRGTFFVCASAYYLCHLLALLRGN
jgi:hypothetical protein